jgi:uncharacterized integral membrane protein
VQVTGKSHSSFGRAPIAGRPSFPFDRKGLTGQTIDHAGAHTSSPFFPVTLASPIIAMGFKVFLRIVVFLAMLFVLLYVGMNNTKSIDFSFPVAFTKGVSEPAAFIYFGIFAIGVIAGAMLNFGGAKRSSPKSEKK